MARAGTFSGSVHPFGAGVSLDEVYRGFAPAGTPPVTVPGPPPIPTPPSSGVPTPVPPPVVIPPVNLTPPMFQLPTTPDTAAPVGRSRQRVLDRGEALADMMRRLGLA